MRVTARMNRSAMRQLSAIQAKAVVMTAMEVLNQNRNEAVMPFDTGYLQNDSTRVDTSDIRKGTVAIVTDAKYAQRLYYHPEYNFQQGKNSNAGGLWWEEWRVGDKRRVPAELFRKFYRKLGRGIVR